jgi:hypothetical protein
MRVGPGEREDRRARLAVAAPMPLDAPVIRRTLPSSMDLAFSHCDN